MRILFCNIAWMKEYRGNEDGRDIPVNGGSFVNETGDAHEKYNFTPVNIEGKEGLYCLGFFETKSHNGKDVNQMRIENIAGCELCATMIFHVLLITFAFFSSRHTGGKSIFMTDTIADSAELMVAPLIGNILVMVNKACGVEDDMVMNVIFINMGADHVFIFSFQHFICKLLS